MIYGNPCRGSTRDRNRMVVAVARLNAQVSTYGQRLKCIFRCRRSQVKVLVGLAVRVRMRSIHKIINILCKRGTLNRALEAYAVAGVIPIAGIAK